MLVEILRHKMRPDRSLQQQQHQLQRMCAFVESPSQRAAKRGCFARVSNNRAVEMDLDLDVDEPLAGATRLGRDLRQHLRRRCRHRRLHLTSRRVSRQWLVG